MRLSDRLAHQGCHSSVVALEPGTVGGLQVETLGLRRFSRGTLGALRAAARAADVVLAHGSSTLPAVSAATVGLNTPFVYRSIGDPSAWVATRARRGRVRLAAARAAGIVALWRGAAVFWHEALRVPADRITVIPNWVEAERFAATTPRTRSAARAQLGLDDEAPVVLCLGALTPEKRVDLAVRAVGSLAHHTLLVVGDGSEKQSLTSLAEQWPGRIRFAGPTPDPIVPLAAADVLVLASRTEGQPAVAIEAGLTGIPVVATRVGGVPDIVLDCRSGILLDDPSPVRLASAIEEAIAKRDEMGAIGRQHCLEHFDLHRIAGTWHKFLQRVPTG